MPWNYNPEEAALKVQPGKYEVQLFSLLEKVSKKGNDMVEIKMRVLRNADTKDEKAKGCQLMSWITQNEYWHRNVRQLCLSTQTPEPTGPISWKVFVKAVALVLVTNEKDGNGEDREKVSRFLPRSGELDERGVALANEPLPETGPTFNTADLDAKGETTF